MSYKFKSYTSSNVKQEKRSLLNAIEFNNDITKAEREKALLSKAISFAQNDNTKLYSLRDASSKLKGILGYLALSASEVIIDETKKPAVLIDLLLVHNNYRSRVYKHFDDSKISQLMLEYAISKFYEAREHIGVSYLILYPDGGKENKVLVNFYKSMDFSYATPKHEWMYMKL